jgi:hypothetical protein
MDAMIHKGPHQPLAKPARLTMPATVPIPAPRSPRTELHDASGPARRGAPRRADRSGGAPAQTSALVATRRAAVDPVPRICVGYAREFFNRVTAVEEEVSMNMLELVIPVKKQLHYKPKVSRDIERSLAARWRAMQSPYRFSYEARMDYKDRLSIEEVRLADLSLRFLEWQDNGWEPNIALARLSFLTRALQRAEIRISRTPIALVSLHSAARLIERAGRKVSDDLFMDNLRPLAELQPCDDLVDMVIPTVDGSWLGRMLPIQAPGCVPAMAFCARTFSAKRNG